MSRGWGEPVTSLDVGQAYAHHYAHRWVIAQLEKAWGRVAYEFLSGAAWALINKQDFVGRTSWYARACGIPLVRIAPMSEERHDCLLAVYGLMPAQGADAFRNIEGRYQYETRDQ